MILNVVLLLLSALLLVYLVYALLRPENFNVAERCLQIAAFIGAVLLLAKPMGNYLTRVFERRRTLLYFALVPCERLLYRIAGIDPE